MSHFRPEPGAKHTTRHSDLDEAHERHLMARLASNDRRALQRLYEAYLRRLSRFFTHVTVAQNPRVVANLVDETLITVWLVRGSLEGAPSVYVRIMRLALGQARRHSYLCRRPAGPTAQPDSISYDASADAISPFMMLGLLPVEERVVAHFVYTGHSREQVAQILEVSCGEVDTLLLELRARLRPVTSPRTVSPATAVPVT
ncbi:MAG TPA: hypothetical protein VGM84_21275 [Steroidobacteraceae bacterium]|jgi:DNA-directed RNA polymerase specialized sigma24 family protein